MAGFVSQLQYNESMKSATLPPIRVAPDFRLELEGVLEQGESLSQFVENAVRTTVAKRKNQAEFIRRGIAAIEATKRDGSGIPAAVVIAKLEAKLAITTAAGIPLPSRLVASMAAMPRLMNSA